jgi:hypothetical protein
MVNNLFLFSTIQTNKKTEVTLGRKSLFLWLLILVSLCEFIKESR